jgi:hypothetical protein
VREVRIKDLDYCEDMYNFELVRPSSAFSAALPFCDFPRSKKRVFGANIQEVMSCKSNNYGSMGVELFESQVP